LIALSIGVLLVYFFAAQILTETHVKDHIMYLCPNQLRWNLWSLFLKPINLAPVFPWGRLDLFGLHHWPPSWSTTFWWFHKYLLSSNKSCSYDYYYFVRQ